MLRRGLRDSSRSSVGASSRTKESLSSRTTELADYPSFEDKTRILRLAVEIKLSGYSCFDPPGKSINKIC